MSPSPAGEGVGDEGWNTASPPSLLMNRVLLSLLIPLIFATEVLADQRRTMTLGIRGVPLSIFDEKYAVSDAQRGEVFLTALRRTREDFHEEPAS